MNRILGFRLLNSEIGNDLLSILSRLFRRTCFRLLNSEIGNDPKKFCFMAKKELFSFRLLNSEIGNDPSNIKMASEWGLRP